MIAAHSSTSGEIAGLLSSTEENRKINQEDYNKILTYLVAEQRPTLTLEFIPRLIQDEKPIFG